MNKYSWLAKSLDLTNAELAWVSSTPEVTFRNPDGSRKYVCLIEFDKKLGRYVSSCGDGKKVFPPLESK